MTTKKTTGPRLFNSPANAMKQYGTAWGLLSDADQASWGLLCAQLNDPVNVGTPGRKTAFGTFVAHAVTAGACGIPMPTTAPSPIVVPLLPDMTTSASISGGTLSLTVTAAAASTSMTLLYGSAPLMENRPLTEKLAYTHLETIGQWASGVPLDVSAAYLRRYYCPRAGRKIALKLVPVSDTGFRGAPVYVEAVLPTASAAAAVPQGDSLKDGLKMG